jgi:Na+-transporting NADH:ubiquinone oxidoreductase subunit NqrB
MMNGSLILFALFMITDPRTIPNSRIGRVLWALLIAVVAFVLRNVFFVNTAVIWALFLVAPLTPLFDRVFAADRFTWVDSTDSAEVLPVLS